ncbi:histone-lysine N-methyltransferase trithorax-like isoform X5 [Polyodon spathula]|uniref:histone-lysine N-methyltransferase trithorax-like isoform X5 n=1 Tax=Polyodon spathula TaxID=7913 RepID=UPI001B7DCC46|nr:histone-lysine N-methyltransferase trithorax-like isoform X5 [Polyodon spathula]
MSCGFCHFAMESKKTGPILQKEDIVAHENCLLFSSGLVTQNTPEGDDLAGFSVEGVKKEINRGRKLHCFSCKKSGATVGCEVKKCKRSYHFLCALNDNAKKEEDLDRGWFRIYCEMHKSKIPEDAIDDESDAESDQTEELDTDDSSEKFIFGTKTTPKRKRSTPVKRLFSKNPRKWTSSPKIGILNKNPERKTDSNKKRFEADPVSKGKNTNESEDEQLAMDTDKNGTCDTVVSDVSTNLDSHDEREDDESSESILIPINAESVSLGSAIYSGSPAEFWKKCRDVKCVEKLFSKIQTAISNVSQKIVTQAASDHDYKFAMDILTASGLWPEVISDNNKADLKEKQEKLKAEMESLSKAKVTMQELDEIMKNIHK